jgi:predicted P-loop ATPase
MGKSSFFAKIGGKWFSDSLTIGDMKDKAAPEKLQGYWILELGELAGLKKVDVETVKAFITRQDDKFRHSYGYSVEDHPRQCIIVGSTNTNDGFLRDITGNRRFWPIKCGKGDKHSVVKMGDEYMSQVWAEAVVWYRNGEKLFLDAKINKMAAEQQKRYAAENPEVGRVQQFLDTPIPVNWPDMSISERRNYIQGFTDSASGVEKTLRQEVCVAELAYEMDGKISLKPWEAKPYATLLRQAGWERFSQHSTPYGKQQIYRRKHEDLSRNEES